MSPFEADRIKLFQRQRLFLIPACFEIASEVILAKKSENLLNRRIFIQSGSNVIFYRDVGLSDIFKNWLILSRVKLRVRGQ